MRDYWKARIEAKRKLEDMNIEEEMAGHIWIEPKHSQPIESLCYVFNSLLSTAKITCAKPFDKAKITCAHCIQAAHYVTLLIFDGQDWRPIGWPDLDLAPIVFRLPK